MPAKPGSPDIELFSPEFDAAYYRARNADVAGYPDGQLREHYELHGRDEGRLASLHCTRKAFTPVIASLGPALEIGPFCNPSLEGPDVQYFDVMDQADLQARARESGKDPARVPAIDHVSPDADLSIVKGRFPVVFSSHAIEHQPDLIGHLKAVESLLEDGGIYALIVPDKRYCFDHFLETSNIAEVLQAHLCGRKVHDLRSIIEHRAMQAHNEAERHWQRDHGTRAITPERLRAAIGEWRDSKGGYVDVHAWQFTPASFRGIIDLLNRMNYTSLRPVRIYDTPRDTNEFCVVLAKPG